MIYLHLNKAVAPDSVYAYQVAGQVVVADAPLAELRPFLLPPDYPLSPFPPSPHPTADAGREIFRQTVIIGRSRLHLACQAHSDGYLLIADQASRFWVTASGDHVSLLTPPAVLPPTLLIDLLLGPGLILALALQGVWCWHGSAVLRGGSAVLFLGESGRGKSTLAAFLGRQPGWRHLADDIVPVGWLAGRLGVRPHFPQLKIAPERQPAAGQPETLPLTAVYLLDAADEPGIVPLSSQPAMLQLVRHTVASRLFDRPLLTRHLAFCQQAAAAIPVHRLHYPRRFEALSLVEALLRQTHP